MLDPGALGTLLIGLDHARRAFDPVPDQAHRRRTAARRHERLMRHRIGAVLRLIASRVDAHEPARA